MQFTESFFQRRLSHAVTAFSGRESIPDRSTINRGPILFRFSRRRDERERHGSREPNSVIGRPQCTESMGAGESRLKSDWPTSDVPRVRIAEIDGVILWAPASDWKQLCYNMMAGALSPGLDCFLRRYLGPGQVFLDIGAAFGVYTVLAATLTGEKGLVHSFEAAPGEYLWFLRNLHENGFLGGNRILPKLVWLGDPNIKCPFRSSGPTAQVDDLVPPSQHVDVIRIGGHYDVLGVLMGMHRICRENSHCQIVLEYCAGLQPFDVDLLAIWRVLNRMGFQIQRIDDGGEAGPCREEEIRDAFSANLLLRPGSQMQWNL